ncbi:MAG: hypothetical protein ABJA98_26985 [Acidobacteriota bacterium]
MSDAADKWPGVDAEQPPTTADDDMKVTIESVLKGAAETDALNRLKSEGCTRIAIAEMLFRLRRTSHTEAIAKRDVDRAMTRLTDAVQSVLRLKNSPVGRYIFGRLTRADQVANELRWVVGRAKAARPKASKKEAPRRDDLRWVLVDYVKQTTGKYHDDEVSLLIGGAEGGSEYSAAAHHQWRYRHRRGTQKSP